MERVACTINPTENHTHSLQIYTALSHWQRLFYIASPYGCVPVALIAPHWCSYAKLT